MGMYDTFGFRCPRCHTEMEVQTKMGDRCLDHWRIGDKTSINDGFYRLVESCQKCNTYPIVEISREGIFYRAYKAPPRKRPDQKINDLVGIDWIWQEGPGGRLLPIGTDIEQEFKKFNDQVQEIVKIIKKEGKNGKNN